MKRSKQQQVPVPEEPQWWKKEIVAKIFVGIILSIVGLGVWIVQKSSEERYGKLRIVSNVDSARIFLTKEFKGYTLTSKAIEISSLEPGSYVLSVEKDGFAAFVNQNIEIAAGKIASVKADLKFEQTPKPIVVDSASAKLAGAIKFYQIAIAVHSKLKNAKIMINGEWEANAPATLSLQKGRYRLRIENEAYYYEEMLQVPSRDLVNVTEDEIKKILNDLP